MSSPNYDSSSTAPIPLSHTETQPTVVVSDDSTAEEENITTIISPYTANPLNDQNGFTLSVTAVLVVVIAVAILLIFGGIILFFYVCSIANGHRLAGEDELKMLEDD